MTALKQLDAQTAAQHCPTWQGSLRETPPSQPTRSRWKLGAAVAVMRSTWNSNFWVFKLGHRRRALYKNCSLRVLRGRTHFLFRIWVSLCSAIFLHPRVELGRACQSLADGYIMGFMYVQQCTAHVYITYLHQCVSKPPFPTSGIWAAEDQCIFTVYIYISLFLPFFLSFFLSFLLL